MGGRLPFGSDAVGRLAERSRQPAARPSVEAAAFPNKDVVAEGLLILTIAPKSSALRGGQRPSLAS
jgi:hypothetical protein